MNEPWFKELAKAQSIQDEIDKRESYQIPFTSAADSNGKVEVSELLAKKPVGRPSTDWRIVAKVLQIYDTSIDVYEQGLSPRIKSLRTIAKEVGNSVDHCTVRNILNAYRRKEVI